MHPTMRLGDAVADLRIRVEARCVVKVAARVGVAVVRDVEADVKNVGIGTWVVNDLDSGWVENDFLEPSRWPRTQRAATS
jgi:hypothetical protein